MNNCIEKDLQNCSSTGHDFPRATEDGIVFVDNDIIYSRKVQSELKRRFSPKKRKSLRLSEVYDFIAENKLQNNDSEGHKSFYNRSTTVYNCGHFLQFACSEDSTRLIHASFCKDRLCPMCNWRRSLKIGAQVSKVMNVLENSGRYKYIFLTLTVKNCQADELTSTVDLIYSGWRFLYNKDPVFRKTVLGSFRALEITYNRKEDTYHPHIHVILVVDKYYYARHFIRQDQWQEMWKHALGVEYEPIVDVRYFNKKKNIRKSVSEVAKYTVKDSDYLVGKSITPECAHLVETIFKTLYKRRLHAFTGVMLDVANNLNLDDMEDGDLTHINDEIRPDLKETILNYHWLHGAYERI